MTKLPYRQQAVLNALIAQEPGKGIGPIPGYEASMTGLVRRGLAEIHRAGPVKVWLATEKGRAYTP